MEKEYECVECYKSKPASAFQIHRWKEQKRTYRSKICRQCTKERVLQRKKFDPPSPRKEKLTTFEEIGKVLGISAGNAWMSYQRGIKKLQKHVSLNSKVRESLLKRLQEISSQTD